MNIRGATPLTENLSIEPCDDKTDLTHVRVFILNNSFLISVLLLTLCVTIATNLTNGLLIDYTRIGSAFNKLSENIYFCILTLTIMAVVFDLLRAVAEYLIRIKNGISWGTFWFQIEEYERVKHSGGKDE